MDAFDLARRVVDGKFSTPVKKAAKGVMVAIDELVVASFGMPFYDREGGFTAGKDGVYVVLPPSSIQPSTVWSKLAWYTPAANKSKRSYGCYADCRDGATAGNGKVENWFELLDLWYDKPSFGSDSGDLNGYRR